MIARKLRDKARTIAAHLLEASEDDLEWENGAFHVKGSPDKSKTIQDCAFAAYTNLPDGLEAGLEGVTYYDPPNMTFPFGTYAAVVEIDRGTGEWKVLRVVAVDDCGVRINPMIVEGQITGGLTEGFAIAAMELITFDDDGNCIGSSFMDYLLPTAWETPKFEMHETVTPSPHHPFGAKGVGESATVGSPAAYVNAVVDALAHAGDSQPRDAGHAREGVAGAGGGGPGGVTPDDVIVMAGRLAADGEPYVLATVVRVRRPASTRPGDRALVRADGSIAGWVGGACAEPVVIRESLRALAAGEPRLVRIGPEGDLDPDGADVVVATTCASEGTVEVLLEPCVAGPLLAVVGDSPAARALSELAPAVGWRVSREVAGGPDAVVIAAMGRGDEDTLQAALASGAGYVGLVASTRRAASVFDVLRERGVDDAALARVRSPAGLDLGPLRQEEIAVAVLAELVAWRHSAAGRRLERGRRDGRRGRRSGVRDARADPAGRRDGRRRRRRVSLLLLGLPRAVRGRPGPLHWRRDGVSERAGGRRRASPRSSPRPSGAASVLDVGCGSGRLAVELAAGRGRRSRAST